MSNGWHETTLDEVFDISSSKRVLQRQWQTSGVPFYRAREIVKLAQHGSVRNELFISEELFRQYQEKYGAPVPGDLMVSAVGTLGACYAVRPGDRFYFKDASVLRFSPKKAVEPRFFVHAFKTNLILDQVNSGSGSTVGTFTIERAKKTKLPLPPLAEQKRIAGILDAADALRAKRRESLAQLDTLLQSTFLNLFGDPVTNPMGWEKKSLGEIAASKPNNGVFRKNPEYSEDREAGRPVVWVEELFRGNEIDTTESRRLEATEVEIEKYGLKYGDILFCRSSLKLDGIAFNNVFLGQHKEALFECHLIRMSPDVGVVNPMFLNLQLRSIPMRANLKSKSKTATMTTIDQKALSSVEVIVPPLNLQRHFAAIVESVEQQKARLRTHLAELDALFASLQSRAFNGEL